MLFRSAALVIEKVTVLPVAMVLLAPVTCNPFAAPVQFTARLSFAVMMPVKLPVLGLPLFARVLVPLEPVRTVIALAKLKLLPINKLAVLDPVVLPKLMAKPEAPPRPLAPPPVPLETRSVPALTLKVDPDPNPAPCALLAMIKVPVPSLFNVTPDPTVKLEPKVTVFAPLSRVAATPALMASRAERSVVVEVPHVSLESPVKVIAPVVPKPPVVKLAEPLLRKVPPE